MSLEETLISVWRQAFEGDSDHVEVDGKSYKIGRTQSKGLRIVEFPFAEHSITGIEQNPETSSQWAQMARQGKRVMQFSCGRRYFANVAESKVTKYPAWQVMNMPA